MKINYLDEDKIRKIGHTTLGTGGDKCDFYLKLKK